jgi:hypothetical protein
MTMERSKNPRDSPDDSGRLFKKPRSEKEIAPSPSFVSLAPSSAPTASISGLFSPISQSKPIFEFASSFPSFGNQGLSNLASSPLFGQAGAATKQSAIPSTASPLVGPAPITTGNRSNTGASTAPSATSSFAKGSGAFGLSVQHSEFKVAAPNAQQDKAKGAEPASAATNFVGFKQDGGATIKQEEGSGTPANTSLTQGATTTIKGDKGSKLREKKALSDTQIEPISGPIEDLDPRGDLLLVAGKAKVNFRVCSRTLSRSSPAWEKKLYGPFSERKNQQGGYGWVVRVPEDNPDALRIVLQAVHCELDKMPASLSRETLFHLTILCGNYDMVRSLKLFWRGWLSRLPPPKPLDSKTFVQQVWIAHKLGDLDSYKATILQFLYSAQKRPNDNDKRLFLDADFDLYEDPFVWKLGIMRTSPLTLPICVCMYQLLIRNIYFG